MINTMKLKLFVYFCRLNCEIINSKKIKTTYDKESTDTRDRHFDREQG
jgi:hypothetical protein